MTTVVGDSTLATVMRLSAVLRLLAALGLVVVQ